jgi:hypothetical protein
MTPEEREHLDSLCKRIAIEKDPQRFDSLVKELEALLEAKHERLQSMMASGSLPATPKPDLPATES